MTQTATERTARRLGATFTGNETEFFVWAPGHERVEVKLVSQNRSVPMEKDADGYHFAAVSGVGPGDRYLYRLGDVERPDPASRFQPEGVHAPSEVVNASFPWEDHWFGIPLADYITYEIHVGTFTPEGTFEAVIPRLERLKSLGVTALELMPVSQFPGARNWGYDGVYPYAAQNSYGGPDGLKKLINACHATGIAVVMDVVYNHMGPEGNYLRDFGPYFTETYKTPWGASLNFDGPGNEGVRRFFIENALMWVNEFRVDALRCDAVHAIFDFSARPFLEELCTAVRDAARQSHRQIFTIAESDLNDNRVIRSRDMYGYGYDSQWSDDFHHALHTLLTGEKTGYYADFGSVSLLRRAYVNGWAYAGDYSAHRGRRHGNSPEIFDAKKFVVCIQNHDQIGNRMKGERLSHLVDFPRQKLAAAAVLTAPFLPLLFMGEEYGEPAPFQYFVSHGDPALVEAVRKGRRDEFKSFGWTGETPDPQSEATFEACKIDPARASEGDGKRLLELYRTLIRLRKETPALRHLSKDFCEVGADDEAGTMWVRRWFGRSECFYTFNFSERPARVTVPTGKWTRLLDTNDARWGGRGGSADERLISDGDAAVELPGLTFVLFSHLKET